MIIKRKHMAKPMSVEVVCHHSMNITQLIPMRGDNLAGINIIG